MSTVDEPGSPGVVGQDPTRREDPDEVGPLDEVPDGHAPDETTDSSDESLPPGAGH
jgi:hypothetical protein